MDITDVQRESILMVSRREFTVKESDLAFWSNLFPKQVLIMGKNNA